MIHAGSTILVTGANGFVGTRVARGLARDEAAVRALVRRPGERKELAFPGIAEIPGDFTDPVDARRATEGADFVVHCAATVGKDLEDARRVNAGGTRAVVDAALAAGVRRLVHISTISVYDLAGVDVVDEDCPRVEEGHQYGVTKAEAERIVEDAAGRGLPCVILRPGAILGVHPTSSWAVKFPERVRTREHELVKDGGNILPLLHAEDLVNAVRLALAADRADARAYNIADHHETFRDFTDRIRGWFGTAPLKTAPESPGTTGTYWTGRISNQRIRTELGYEAKHTYDEGMREAERYWKEKEGKG